ncbi:addiction module antitoxin [Planctomycetaceae bacterium SCGC AG-212-F19]|nr:addiction module antitoxin [Planctomycetaceae bacterium SCGC AG-212-F19]
MDNLTISLPTPLKEFIDAQVAAGDSPNASEFIVALLREEQKRKVREKIEALLLEGLASESSEMTREEWDELKREAMEELDRRKACK